MTSKTKRSKRSLLFAAGIIMIPLTLTVLYTKVQGSDHAGTVESIANNFRADLTDLHIFPGRAGVGQGRSVVLAMSVRGLIPAGGSDFFDPDVLYQFKIDTNGDNVEDQVIQATFGAKGAGQQVRIAGPVAPSTPGSTVNVFEANAVSTGTFGNQFTINTGQPTQGLAFAGLRSDPFFIDLDRLLITKSATDPPAILPDRGVAPGLADPPNDPNEAKSLSWRAPGQAVDFLANSNVLAIVVEVPRASLGNGKIGVWITTSVKQ